MAYDDGWYLHPKLRPILERTYGIIVYQEQVMQIAQALCGYSLGQADVLRRIIGKKKQSEMGPAMERFIRDGVANGVDEETMIEIARQIDTFANYSFNIAHAAAYGYTSYQAAYVKAHFPLAFWCGRLNAYLGDREDTVRYVAECKKSGIEILLPDVMLSDRRWKVEGESLRTGYAAVKNLGENTVINHQTRDLKDFIRFNKHMNKRVVESMVKAGMFGGNRAELLWLNEAYRKYLAQQAYCQEMMVEWLGRGNEKKVSEWRDKLCKVSMPEFPGGEFDDTAGENEVLGFSNGEILDGFVSSGCNNTTTLCGEVVAFRSRLDKKKNKMAFVMFRTKNGMRELVMFHRNYREMEVGKVYIVELKETQIIDMMEARKVA